MVLKKRIAVVMALLAIPSVSLAQQVKVSAEETAPQISTERYLQEVLDRLQVLEHKVDNLTPPQKNLTTPNRCPLASGFVIEKSPDAFNVLYRGQVVYSLAGARLRNDIFGGHEPYLDCDSNLDSSEMFAMVLGWKRDLFMGFGVIRENGRVVGLQKVDWFPHDSAFSPITMQPNYEYFVRFGRLNDLNERICWNAKGNNRWTFSPNQRVGFPQPCSTESPPYGAAQVKIGIQPATGALIEELSKL